MEVTSDRLSLAYRELSSIPAPIAAKFGPQIRELDLSNNNISDLLVLKSFTKLQVLVLDSNKVNSHTKFPLLDKLHTLWVNSNCIENLTIFIDKLAENTPNLKFLSMLKNDACPNFFNGHSLKDYNDYRHYVISRLKYLTCLDSTPISDAERAEANRVYSSLASRETREQSDRRRDEDAMKKKMALTEATSAPEKKKKRSKGKSKKDRTQTTTTPTSETKGEKSDKGKETKDENGLPLPNFETGPSSQTPPPIKSNDGSSSDWSSEEEDDDFWDSDKET
eukprot:TRINITY_DN2814_c0_g1_i1.p1 TRINITY_DN2814_c0_g1~~TRINITY_DN2814_c0_g1_i1.p1  ORF type:complete len:279 (-),score=76.62 TRINITY_DN2814_c0_g1_i1:167-1003(-)